MYQDVSASKVVIKDAKHFAEYSDQVTNIKVEYIDKSEVVVNDLSDAVEVKGTLKIHHIDRIITSQVKFYYNSTYKELSLMYASLCEL